MSLQNLSFGLAALSFIFSIIIFMIGDQRTKAIRIGVSVSFLLGTLLCLLIAFFTSIGGQSQGSYPPSVDNSKDPPINSSFPQLVTTEYTGAQKLVNYDKSLSDNDVIVGSGWGFNSTTGGCVAFLIKGPGHFQFSVDDGFWEQYSSTISSEQSEQLLKRHTDILQKDYPCSTAIKIVRLP
ncbi:MAG: hypothetical protein ABI904_14500 [Chloroflexota bacterium]